MNRRHFLSAISAGAVGSAFLKFSFADEADDARAAEARKLAVESLARAKERGKPLLVLVAPKHSAEFWYRGQLFGSWLANADEALLADLALFEIACVPVSALEGSSIRDLETSPDPLMLVIESHETEPRAIVIDDAAPQSIDDAVRGRGSVDETYEAKQVRADAAVHERDAFVSRWLRDAAKIDERLPALAERTTAALDVEQRAQVAKNVAEPSKLDARLVLRAAASLRHAAKNDARLPAAAIAAVIAKASADAVRTHAPDGARWAERTGCGFVFDDPTVVGDDDDSGVSCGIAFVPEAANRFLAFIARRET